MGTWGGPSDDPVFIASREVLEKTAGAHASPELPGASVFPETASFPQQEQSDGLTKAASEIQVYHKMFNMGHDPDVLLYEKIQSKAMMGRQQLISFELSGQLPPEGEYHCVLTESGNWTKEGDYIIALKYSINKVSHRMGSQKNA